MKKYIISFVFWLTACLFWGFAIENSIIQSLIMFGLTYPVIAITLLGSMISKLLKAKTNVFIHPVIFGTISFFIAIIGLTNVIEYFNPNVHYEFTTREQELEEDFQDLLPESNEMYTLAFLINQGDEIPGNLPYIEKYYSLSTLETAKSMFPRLKVKESPTFLIINKKGEILIRAHDINEIQEFLLKD